MQMIIDFLNLFMDCEYGTVGDALSYLPNICRRKAIHLHLYQYLARGINNKIHRKDSKRLPNHEAPGHPQITIETKSGEPLYEKTIKN